MKYRIVLHVDVETHTRQEAVNIADKLEVSILFAPVCFNELQDVYLDDIYTMGEEDE